MTKYYIHKDNEQKGPYTIDQLKGLELMNTTRIWHVGLEEWKTVAEISEVNKLLPTTPPPLIPPLHTTLTPQSPETQNEYEAEPPRSNKTLHYLISLLVLGAIVFGAFYLYNHWAQEKSGSNSYSSSSSTTDYSSNVPTYEEKVISVEDEERGRPTSFLSISGNYKFNFIGRKVKINGNITNAASVASFKDVVVRVTFLTKTSTVLGSEEYIIYEKYPPSSNKKFFLKIKTIKGSSAIKMDIVNATAN